MMVFIYFINHHAALTACASIDIVITPQLEGFVYSTSVTSAAGLGVKTHPWGTTNGSQWLQHPSYLMLLVP